MIFKYQTEYTRLVKIATALANLMHQMRTVHSHTPCARTHTLHAPCALAPRPYPFLLIHHSRSNENQSEEGSTKRKKLIQINH